jgi:CRP-like cAMP-binding protein
MLRPPEMSQPSLPSRAPGIQSSLKGMPIFSGVGDHRLEELARASHRKAISRGEALFRAGESPESVIVLTRGLVKVVRHAPDGSESILGLFGPRDAVGLIAVLSRRPFPATAIALTDQVEAVFVAASTMLEAMKLDASLAMAVNQSVTQQATVLRVKIDVMSAGQVAQRLASLLVNLAERFGDEQEDGTTLVPVVLTRGELSCLVGARVETTIRVLSAWQKQGILETTKDGFVLRDPASLASVQLGESPGS